MKVVEAFWIWTEPHSKRLRVGIDVEKSILDGKVTLRQRVEIMYVIINRQCLECIRTATDHSWGAVIQLRQRGGHTHSLSKGLAHIENEIWRASLHNLMLGVEKAKNGLDMFFKQKNQAEKVVTFLTARLPATVKLSKKMVSADRKSNTQKYEHAFLVDVAPLVKHDIVLVPKDRSKGSGQELMVVNKVSSSIHCISPVTLKKMEISPTKYFAAPFLPLMSPSQLVSFIVLDVEPMPASESEKINTKQASSRTSRKVRKAKGREDVAGEEDEGSDDLVRNQGGILAEIEIARESDLGCNNITFRVISHLGHLLLAGDSVLGYDLTHSSTFSDLSAGGRDFSQTNAVGVSQDIVLVRKVFTGGESRDDSERISSSIPPPLSSGEGLTNEEEELLEDSREFPVDEVHEEA